MFGTEKETGKYSHTQRVAPHHCVERSEKKLSDKRDFYFLSDKFF